MPKDRHIVLDQDSYEVLLDLKRRNMTFQDVIMDLVHAVYPEPKEDLSQGKLNLGDTCPLCEAVLKTDEDGNVFCALCGFEGEGGET